jgi:hypothetical protein
VPRRVIRNSASGRHVRDRTRKHGIRRRDRGRGPGRLSAAIRLKQIDADLNVVVLEKGSEVGAHILSGAVLDPSASTR